MRNIFRYPSIIELDRNDDSSENIYIKVIDILNKKNIISNEKLINEIKDIKNMNNKLNKRIEIIEKDNIIN